MRYRSVSVTERGGPEVLQVIENDLRPPSAGEVRIKILATPVCGPDIQARYGQTPIAPKIPFVPGYAIVGIVDAIGAGVTTAAVGDRVAALTVFGGYAEYIYLDEENLIPVPGAPDPDEGLVTDHVGIGQDPAARHDAPGTGARGLHVHLPGLEVARLLVGGRDLDDGPADLRFGRHRRREQETEQSEKGDSTDPLGHVEAPWRGAGL